MGVCMRYKNDRDRAVESLNICFVKIIQNIDKMIKSGNHVGWMKRVMTNQLIDEYRKEKRKREVEKQVDFSDSISDSMLSDSVSTIYNTYVEQIDASEIRSYIQELPDNTKMVFMLYVVEGYKHREIAEMLDFSINTSKWHLREARKKLKTILESNGQVSYSSKKVKFG